MSGSVYPASFAPFTEYEAEAKTLRTWQHSLIPGLLQTEGYARAVLSTKPNAGRDQIDRLVVGRLARQGGAGPRASAADVGADRRGGAVPPGR